MKSIKRFICLALTLCLAAGSGSALAAEGDLSFWVNIYGSELRYCRSMAVCGETAYLMDTDLYLYRYAPGDAEPVMIDDTLANYISPQDKNAATGSINELFSLEGELYGIEFGTGWVWRLINAEGAAEVTPLYRLDMSFNADEDHYIPSVICMDGFLYLYSPYSYELFRFALEDAARPTTLKTEGLQALAPYKDGLMIAVTEPDYSQATPMLCQLVTYDLETQETAAFYQADLSRGNASAVYDPVGDTLYYASGFVVYALSQPDGQAVPCAYLAEDVNENGLHWLPGGQLLIRGYTGIYVRTPAPDGVESQPLTIAGEYGSEPHLAALLAHPEINVVPTEITGGLQALTAAILSGDTSLDMLRLQLDYDPVNSLIDKGYLADLSVYPELMAIAQQMDERLLAPLTRDGKLYGLPVELNTPALTVNVEAWTETLGLSLDELPTTYPELLDFFANYMYDYGEEHENVLLMDSWNLRMDLLDMLLRNEAAAQLRDGLDAVSFDTPRFRRLLEALDAIDFSDISLSEMLGENATDADYNEIYSKDMLFSVSYGLSPAIFDSDSTWLPLLLRLDEETPPVLNASLIVMCISSRSAHPGSAAQYLGAYLSNLQPEGPAVTLFPNRNDGVPNPRYELDIAGIKRNIQKTEAALEAASPENRAELEENLGFLNDYLPKAEERRYLLSAESIAAYREKIAPYLYPISEALFDSDGADSSWSLIGQYVDQAIDADAFVKELSNRMRLMQLEAQ